MIIQVRGADPKLVKQVVTEMMGRLGTWKTSGDGVSRFAKPYPRMFVVGLGGSMSMTTVMKAGYVSLQNLPKPWVLVQAAKSVSVDVEKTLKLKSARIIYVHGGTNPETDRARTELLAAGFDVKRLTPERAVDVLIKTIDEGLM